MRAALARPPAKPKPQDRRAAIIAVSRAAFLENGYAATSMSQIAARLGGSKGTLYTYVRDKADLFQAVVSEHSSELAAELFDDPAVERSVALRLSGLAERFLAALMRPQTVALQRIIIAESDRFPELGRMFFEAGPDAVRARIAGLLGEMMRRGDLRAADPHVAARLFADLTIAGAMLRRLWGVDEEPTATEVSARVAVSVDLFLRAYAPGSPNVVEDPPAN